MFTVDLFARYKVYLNLILLLFDLLDLGIGLKTACFEVMLFVFCFVRIQEKFRNTSKIIPLAVQLEK